MLRELRGEWQLNHKYALVSFVLLVYQSLSSKSEADSCPVCSRQREALRKLWTQVTDRAHPTVFNWRCSMCGQERKLVID